MMKRIAALSLAAAVAFTATSAAASNRRTPVVRAVEKARPAVVNIYTERLVDTPFRSGRPSTGDPFFDRFFGGLFSSPSRRSPQRERRSLGSGVIIGEDGLIVTNEHVILRASGIRVLMADESEYEAELVGSDSDSDLAVLRIKSDTPLPHIEIPKEDDVLIGETVVAIGNPYGLSHTVTVGVVSAVDRTIEAGETVYHDFIQTDASINPGNSGGPLINVDGRLVGINTAIHADAEGIGFAIPVHRVRGIVDQIVETGSVRPAWIGVRLQELTPEIAFHFRAAPRSGVLIAGVDDGSPASKAGLTRGQIITRVAGRPCGHIAAFERATRGLTAGDTLPIEVRNDEGETKKLTLRIAYIPDDRLASFAWWSLGLSLEDGGNTPVPGPRVREVRANSPAADIGLAAGDKIAAIGGRDCEDLASFHRLFAGLRNRRNVLLSIVRGRSLYRISIPLNRGR